MLLLIMDGLLNEPTAYRPRSLRSQRAPGLETNVKRLKITTKRVEETTKGHKMTMKRHKMAIKMHFTLCFVSLSLSRGLI